MCGRGVAGLRQRDQQVQSPWDESRKQGRKPVYPQNREGGVRQERAVVEMGESRKSERSWGCSFISLPRVFQDTLSLLPFQEGIFLYVQKGLIIVLSAGKVQWGWEAEVMLLGGGILTCSLINCKLNVCALMSNNPESIRSFSFLNRAQMDHILLKFLLQ